MHFIVVNPFTKSNNCQECGNIKVRDNDNRIIDARWASAPDISMPVKQRRLLQGILQHMLGSISIFSNIILINLKAANVLSFLLKLFLYNATRSFFVKDFLRRKYELHSPCFLWLSSHLANFH